MLTGDYTAECKILRYCVLEEDDVKSTVPIDESVLDRILSRRVLTQVAEWCFPLD